MRITQFVAPNSDLSRAAEILQARMDTRENLGIRYPYETAKCEGVDGYWTQLLGRWTMEDDLVVIEQDMVVYPYHIESFIGCRYPFCTIPYKMPNRNWSLFTLEDAPNIDALGVTNRPENNPVKWVEGSALGLVRFTRAAQRLIPLEAYNVENHHWSLMDIWISKFMSKILYMPWHVHYPPVYHMHT